MGFLRSLSNLLLLLLVLVVFALALLMILANPEALTLNLLVSQWQPALGTGAMLIVFLMLGLLLGFVLGLVTAWQTSRRRSS